MKKIKIVKAHYNDSIEQFMLDAQIQNTMKQFWPLQDQYDVKFEMDYELDTMPPTLNIFAIFKHDIEASLYKLQESEKIPVKKLMSWQFTP